MEPFNTTGEQGLIKNMGPSNSSNIYRVTGATTSRKARAKKQLKPLGAQMARNLEERYETLPFAERWAYPMLEKPFPDADEAEPAIQMECLGEETRQHPVFETYHVLACADDGMVGQFEHTVAVTSGGPEILTVE